MGHMQHTLVSGRAGASRCAVRLAVRMQLAPCLARCAGRHVMQSAALQVLATRQEIGFTPTHSWRAMQLSLSSKGLGPLTCCMAAE